MKELIYKRYTLDNSINNYKSRIIIKLQIAVYY